MLIHKNIPIRSIGVEIMPAYYEDYLKKQYPDEYHNPVEAFRKIDQTTDFPEMSRLLTELQNYRGDGIAAKLFYEGKVAEALSLVVEYQKKRPAATGRLATQDIENIQTVATYLSDHYAAEVPMERLTQIACMGTTKLKSSFKKVYDCTITEYIQQRRMSQAEYLLTNTDLSIGQIAQTVGYSTSSRFAELFRKSTGYCQASFGKSDAGDETSKRNWRQLPSRAGSSSSFPDFPHLQFTACSHHRFYVCQILGVPPTSSSNAR